MDDLGIEPLGIEPLGDSLGPQELGIEPLGIEPLDRTGRASIPGAEAYDKAPPKPVEEDLGKKSLGILESLATAATGSVAPFAGMFGAAQDTFRQGVSNLVTGDHSKQVDFRKRADEIAAGLTYQPRTETGQTIAEKVLTPVGENLQALGPLAPHFTTGGQVVGTKMLLGRDKVKAPRVEPNALSKLDEAIAARKEQAAVRKAEQAVETERAANMAPPTNENPPIIVTREGVAMPGGRPETEAALVARNSQMDAMQRQLDAEQQARNPDQLFPEDPYQGTLADQGPQPGQPAPIPDPRGSLSNRRQMGFDFSPEQKMQVDSQGRVLRGQEDAHTVLGVERQNAIERAQAAEATRVRQYEEAQARLAAAQETINARQAALEQEVAQRQSLDFNAAERARQEAAPAISEAERVRMQNEEFELKKAQWAAEDARLAMESEKASRMRQMEIDDTPHVLPDTNELLADQYGVADGVGRVDENGMPIRADRSLEAQQLENPLQRNLWGDELADTGLSRTDVPLTQALDSLESTPFKGDARDQALAMLGEPRALGFNARMRGQGGGLYLGAEVKKARDEAPLRWYTASPEAGRKTSYSLESQAARPNAEAQRYGPGQYIAESRDFSSVYGGPDGRMYTIEAPFSRPFDVTQPGNARIYDSLVERTGSRAAANQLLQKSGYDAITFQSPRGDRLANIFNEKPLQDIGPAREKIRQQELTLQEYEPGKRDPFHKQRGHIRVPGGDRSVNEIERIKAFRNNLKQYAVDRSSPEEFLAANKNAPDIDQNIGQRISNNLTKGSIYLSDRLKNAGYSRVTARFREADSLAKGAQQRIVHDIYAPTVRALSDTEKARTWSALKKMEDAGVRMSDNELVDLGFNQKERDAISMHQIIMDEMVPKINEALDAAGLSHIKAESAFVAAKLEGTFRKVMLDKDNNVIGALGDRTRSGLAKQEAEFKKLFPEAVSGEEIKMGGRRGNTNNLTDIINFLSENDPHMAEYLRASKEAGARDAMNFRGAKTHTMEKKGVVGMAGNRPWESAVTNAREGFDAQVAYLNRMLEWAEKAKAEAETRPIIDGLKGTQPKAMKLAEDYRDFSLGKNPYDAAKIADAIGEFFDTTAGGKLSYASDLVRGTKKATNIKLLTLNPGFLAANILQPLRNMPEIGAFLKAKGMPNGELAGMASMGKVSMQMATENYSPILREAMEYADTNHIYASDLIDQRQGTGRAFSGEGAGQRALTAAQALEHISQLPASKIEGTTRKTFFLTLVDMLHENGIRKEDGLFDIAANFTDRGMNRYSMDESPVWVKALGGAGKLPYNLMSFKFNELSRFASNFREMTSADKKSVRPLATALAMQVAAGGLMGMIGYSEANAIVKLISEALGSPTSLTKLLLDNGDKKIVGPVTLKDVAYGGLSTATGVDFTNRMGIGPIAGSGSPADTLLPGVSAWGAAGTSAYEFAKDPSKYNAAKAAVDILPGGSMLDRHFFSKDTYTDKEMGFNRNKVEAGVKRNSADKMAKNFGMTGVNEASQKAKLYEQKQQDMWYEDKQKSIVTQMGKEFFDNGKITKELAQKYIKAEGDPNKIGTIVEEIATKQKLSAPDREKLRTAAQAAVNPNKMKRRFY